MMISPAIQPRTRRWPAGRSEEHTSELQSHVNLVCRLLLEKKKKQIQQLPPRRCGHQQALISHDPAALHRHNPPSHLHTSHQHPPSRTLTTHPSYPTSPSDV